MNVYDLWDISLRGGKLRATSGLCLTQRQHPNYLCSPNANVFCSRPSAASFYAMYLTCSEPPSILSSPFQPPNFSRGQAKLRDMLCGIQSRVHAARE